jgi:hypothetical protein
VVGKTFLACLFPIQTRVSDRSHLVTFDVTILFWDAGPRPENNMDTTGKFNRRPPHAKETSPKITPNPAPRSRAIRDFCSIELSNCTVNKRTFQVRKSLPLGAKSSFHRSVEDCFGARTGTCHTITKIGMCVFNVSVLQYA